MRIDELKAFKNQRPFQPFTIFMADGRNLEITHPDAVAWSDEQNRTVAVTPKGGTWQIFDVMLITALSLKNEFSQP